MGGGENGGGWGVVRMGGGGEMGKNGNVGEMKGGRGKMKGLVKWWSQKGGCEMRRKEGGG